MTAIPGNIAKEHIIQAIIEIDSNSIPEKRKSKNHFIIHNGKRYPQKYVLSLANKFANGKELEDFNANQAQNFFKKFDFPIDEKIKHVSTSMLSDNSLVSLPDPNKELSPEEASTYIDSLISRPISEIFASLRKPKTDGGGVMNSINDCIIFPNFNSQFSIEDLAKTYMDIEKGKNVDSPIHYPFDCNVIPSAIKGECKDVLVGIIVDKRDFERRMPEILASHIGCMRHNKTKTVILAVCYWDATSWEITWKKPFEAVGGEVYRQMYDGKPERII